MKVVTIYIPTQQSFNSAECPVRFRSQRYAIFSKFFAALTSISYRVIFHLLLKFEVGKAVMTINDIAYQRVFLNPYVDLFDELYVVFEIFFS